MSRDIFAGPQLRGSIAAAMRETGRWEGRRGRLRMRVEKVAQPLLTGEYIRYTARNGRGRKNLWTGFAETTTAAVEALDRIWKSLPAEERNHHESAAE